MEEGIKTLTRENNKIVEKGIITLRREIMKLRESIKVVVAENKKH